MTSNRPPLDYEMHLSVSNVTQQLQLPWKKNFCKKYQKNALKELKIVLLYATGDFYTHLVQKPTKTKNKRSLILQIRSVYFLRSRNIRYNCGIKQKKSHKDQENLLIHCYSSCMWSDGECTRDVVRLLQWIQPGVAAPDL